MFSTCELPDNRHCVSTAHPPSDTRIATGVPQSSRSSRQSSGCSARSPPWWSFPRRLRLISVNLLITSSSSSGDFSTSFSSTRGTSSVWRNPCSSVPRAPASVWCCRMNGMVLFQFCRTQLACLSLARLLARLETSQECLVRGTR